MQTFIYFKCTPREMIIKPQLIKIITQQKKELQEKEGEIQREALEKISLKTSHAIILTGIRRCGKSTVLKQLMKKKKNFHYFNFEDPRAAGLELKDFESLLEAFEEVDGKGDTYFFDEIQNMDRWEILVRALLDRNKKCILTGSNASLLSRELGTKLTGRHLSYELFPFSYAESLNFQKKKTSMEECKKYMLNGGFPEYLKEKNTEILQSLFLSILTRDVLLRYKLKEEKIIKNLAGYLITNVGKEFTYNSLSKIFQFGSTNSVISYIGHLENAYLFFTISKFDYSLKKQLVHAKKIYSIDPGLSNANTSSFSEDRGRVLENCVFLHLRRKYKEIYYFKEKQECDFIVRDKEKNLFAIQVCYELTEENQEREIQGLKEAMQTCNIQKGLIITLNQEGRNGNILILPIWKWLLEKP